MNALYKTIGVSFFWIICLFQVQSQTLNYPVDIVYHEATGRYFVSNWTQEGTGNILEVNAAGDPISIFTSNADYPSGLSIIGNTLYYINNKDLYGGILPSYLFGIDISSGNQVMDRLLDADGCYFDLMDNDGSNLYFGDSEKSTLYKYNIAENTLTSLTTVINPFGICYDFINDRIIFTQSDFVESFLKSIKPDGTGETTLMNFTGYLEGIVMDQNGRFYYSSWGNDVVWGNESVYTNDPTFGSEEMLSTGHNRPFGMCIRPDKKLYVCNWGGHSFSFIDIAQYLPVFEYQSEDNTMFELYPNPCQGFTYVRFQADNNHQADISLSDAHGKVLKQDMFEVTPQQQDVKINLEGLPKGLYFVSVTTPSGQKSKKLILD